MRNVPNDGINKREIVLPDTGGFISGPMAEDTRPEFNPAYTVVLLVRALGEHGVQTQVSDSMMYAATIAAADLLRAIGVRPASAPERGR